MAVVLGLLLHHILFCCSRPRRGVLLVVLLVPLQRVVRHDLVLVDLLLLVVDEGSLVVPLFGIFLLAEGIPEVLEARLRLELSEVHSVHLQEVRMAHPIC